MEIGGGSGFPQAANWPPWSSYAYIWGVDRPQPMSGLHLNQRVVTSERNCTINYWSVHDEFRDFSRQMWMAVVWGRSSTSCKLPAESQGPFLPVSVIIIMAINDI